MIELYARLLARCRTPNQVNQVHIALENRMSPLELQALCLAVEARPAARGGGLLQALAWRDGRVAHVLRRLRPKSPVRPESREWIHGLSDRAARSGKADPEPFVRRRLLANVVSFTAGGPSAGKTLVICFAGKSLRLFMPIPVFLQHVAAGRFDLLVLRDPSRNCYRNGLPGVAADLPGVVDAIDGLIDRSAYRGVVSYGTSGGGLPAIVTALRLGLDKGISVGGRGPLDPRWQAALAGGARQLLLDSLQMTGDAPDLLLVHAADCERDASAARSLAQLVPARTLVIHGREGEEVGHNALLPLLNQSRLAAFLASVLDAGGARARPALRTGSR